MDAFHQHARELEALELIEHARAARKDGDHYARLYKQAKTDESNFIQRAERCLRALRQRIGAANDS